MTTGRGDKLEAVVVGAGIAGLSAAFWLAKAGRRVAVLEEAAEAGGVIETWREGEWLFELGPNTVLESNPAIGDLIRDAGLAGRKLEASPAGRQRYLWKRGRLHPLPASPPSLLATPLFPLSAKLRLLLEPWIRRAPEDREESIAQFVRRRLGQSFLDYAVAPFVSGIYAGDPERLSVRWAVPRIAELERVHGSLIRGALARRQGPAPAGAMISFRKGLAELPRQLAQRVGELRLETPARRILRREGGFLVETPEGSLETERVILAVPATTAAGLLDEATGGRSRLLAEVPYAPVAVVALGFPRAALEHPLDGFGFLAPRVEGLRLLGCLFSSAVFPERAPAGHVALTAFLGGATDPEIVERPEEEILGTVLGDLRQALGISGDPVISRVRRWRRGIPQYEVGHGRFVERAKELERDLPGLHFAASYLTGVSVPDCVKSGTDAACEILEC